MPAQPATKRCPSCGSTVPDAAKICGQCNSYLHREPNTSVVPQEPAVPAADADPRSNRSARGVFIWLLISGALVAVMFPAIRSAINQAPGALSSSNTADTNEPVQTPNNGGSNESSDQPTQAQNNGPFTGKIADLPQAAQDVLAFQPADNPQELQSDSIATRFETVCGYSEYIGSDDFPGSITIASQPHGWTRVSWTLSCAKGGFGSSAPIAIFELSHDGEHVREVNSTAETVVLY